MLASLNGCTDIVKYLAEETTADVNASDYSVSHCVFG